MYPAVQNQHITEKYQNHIIIFKYSQAMNLTPSASLTGHVFFLFYSSHFHSTLPQKGYDTD